MEIYASDERYAEVHILSSIIAWMANRNVHWDLRENGPYGFNAIVDADDMMFAVVANSTKRELNDMIEADEERQMLDFGDQLRAWFAESSDRDN